MRSIGLPVGGILIAALLDHHWSWGTVASVLVALYCHRLYSRAPGSGAAPRASVPADELRPGWAVRWGAAAQTDGGAAPKRAEVG
jgi:hypothetical protein